MNGYIEGKQIIYFLSPFSIGINSQRITSCRNLYFPVTVDPSLKGFHCPKKLTGSCKTQKLSPFDSQKISNYNLTLKSVLRYDCPVL